MIRYVLLALSVVTKGPLTFILCGLTFGLALIAWSVLLRSAPDQRR